MNRLVSFLRTPFQASVASKQAGAVALRVLDSAQCKLVSGGTEEKKKDLPKTKW